MFIYPAIDIRGGRCVRLRQGDYAQETVYEDDPVAVAHRWQREGADRLHVVDLDGARSGYPVHKEIVRRIVQVGIPVQVGGGVRSEADIANLFDSGVRWVVVGTRALQQPDWLMRVTERWPGRIVLALDARNGQIAVEGWRQQAGLTTIDLVRRLPSMPLAAIAYTDIQRDGTLSGPNEAALREIQQVSPWPVIASGGVASLQDVRRLIELGTWGCIIGRALYEGTIHLSEAIALARSASAS